MGNKRIRNFKHEFFESESNGRLTRDGRLLFLGLISEADDQGRFRAGIPYLAGSVFPYDPDGQQVLSKELPNLVALGKIALYVRQGFTYGFIVKWFEHQRPSHPASSKLPEPPAKYQKNLRRNSGASPENLVGEGEGEGEWKGDGNGKGEGDRVLTVVPSTTFDDSTVITPTNALHVLPIFLGWIEETRDALNKNRPTELRLLKESRPKKPATLTWWADVAKPETRTLGEMKLAYHSFLEDQHWKDSVPRWPIRAFAAQWNEQGLDFSKKLGAP